MAGSAQCSTLSSSSLAALPRLFSPIEHSRFLGPKTKAKQGHGVAMCMAAKVIGDCCGVTFTIALDVSPTFSLTTSGIRGTEATVVAHKSGASNERRPRGFGKAEHHWHTADALSGGAICCCCKKLATSVGRFSLAAPAPAPTVQAWGAWSDGGNAGTANIRMPKPSSATKSRGDSLLSRACWSSARTVRHSSPPEMTRKNTPRNSKPMCASCQSRFVTTTSRLAASQAASCAQLGRPGCAPAAGGASAPSASAAASKSALTAATKGGWRSSVAKATATTSANHESCSCNLTSCRIERTIRLAHVEANGAPGSVVASGMHSAAGGVLQVAAVAIPGMATLCGRSHDEASHGAVCRKAQQASSHATELTGATIAGVLVELLHNGSTRPLHASVELVAPSLPPVMLATPPLSRVSWIASSSAASPPLLSPRPSMDLCSTGIC
mmetsp:Transcript_98576/g.278780  ORF Transcript_98576/g.278780 Transcript_98576/m.278780 type:complete len:440 (-) Transcript_98576:128-1447(-)